jgi:20S proteasome alpha/beta subunit
MTIAIGFWYGDGVLVCSDSLYTAGALKLSGKKVFRAEIGEERVIFAIAGSVPYGKMAVEKAVSEIAAKTDRTKAILKKAVEDVLLDVYRSHLYPHPEFRKFGGPEFELVVGAWSHIDGLEFFYTSDTAVTDITDHHCLGYGQDLAYFLIKQIFRHPSLSVDDAASVAVHVLRETKENVSFCGGPSQYACLSKNGKMCGRLGLDLSGKEEMSEAVSQAVRRLYLIAADLGAKKEQIDSEIEQLAMIVRTSRDYLREQKERLSGSHEILKASAHIVEPPDFKL